MADVLDNNGEMERSVREALAKAIKPVEGMIYPRTLQADWVDTPIGPMLAAGDESHVYLLSFIEKSGLQRKAALMQKKLNAGLELGDSAAVRSILGEVREYFGGTRRSFETPLHLTGSAFQIRAWEELRKVPFGHTISYAELARRIDKPAAFRAVAQANSQNPIAIAVPCHRVVNADGGAGGYGGGVDRKAWLLDFEKQALTDRPD